MENRWWKCPKCNQYLRDGQADRRTPHSCDPNPIWWVVLASDELDPQAWQQVRGVTDAHAAHSFVETEDAADGYRWARDETRVAVLVGQVASHQWNPLTDPLLDPWHIVCYHVVGELAPTYGVWQYCPAEGVGWDGEKLDHPAAQTERMV